MANFKKDFPLYLITQIGYFDSAATSQKPKVVIEAEKFWYENLNANIKRGAYGLAERATEEYEKSRRTVAEFLGVSPANIIFTKGATEAINLVAQAWGLANLRKNDVILLTEMEHHANLVPWQLVAQAKGAQIAVLANQTKKAN
jgi:cysteine desulfurase/selenocysteine lyase